MQKVFSLILIVAVKMLKLCVKILLFLIQTQLISQNQMMIVMTLNNISWKTHHQITMRRKAIQRKLERKVIIYILSCFRKFNFWFLGSKIPLDSGQLDKFRFISATVDEMSSQQSEDLLKMGIKTIDMSHKSTGKKRIIYLARDYMPADYDCPLCDAKLTSRWVRF